MCSDSKILKDYYLEYSFPGTDSGVKEGGGGVAGGSVDVEICRCSQAHFGVSGPAKGGGDCNRHYKPPPPTVDTPLLPSINYKECNRVFVPSIINS